MMLRFSRRVLGAHFGAAACTHQSPTAGGSGRAGTLVMVGTPELRFRGLGERTEAYFYEGARRLGAGDLPGARAMALVRLSRYADARVALETAMTQHPDQPGFTHALARILAAAPDDGVRDGRRALALVEALQGVFGTYTEHPQF